MNLKQLAKDIVKQGGQDKCESSCDVCIVFDKYKLEELIFQALNEAVDLTERHWAPGLQRADSNEIKFKQEPKCMGACNWGASSTGFASCLTCGRPDPTFRHLPIITSL